MKKLFLGAAIAMSSLAFAQQFGVKGGVNFSTVSNSDNLAEGVDSKSKIGFQAGLFMNAPIGENFSVQPEVLYNSLGAKLTGNDEIGNDGSLRLNLDYISVPVMLQYNATPSFYLEAGPQFSFLVDSKLKTEVNGETESVDLDNDDFNSFDFGIGLGAGYWFVPNFGINARYVAGFTDVAKNNDSDTTYKNNAFHLGLAYKF